MFNRREPKKPRDQIMFKRRVFQGVIIAVQNFFRENPKMDNEYNRHRYERAVRNRSGGWVYPRNGAKECERRRVQIEAGQLTEANGLTYETPPFKSKSVST